MQGAVCCSFNLTTFSIGTLSWRMTCICHVFTDTLMCEQCLVVVVASGFVSSREKDDLL